MSGHHPAHTRVPMGNPPPVEHGIGTWNHLGHEAPGVGLGALNQQQQNLLRGIVPQTAHLGSALPLRPPLPAWLNKVAGSSHNGDGSSLPTNPGAGAPANQLFMQMLANQNRGVNATVPAGYCAPNPYQGDMIDLSRPAASLERTEPLPLVTGNASSTEKESHLLVRNGTAVSENVAPFNGQLDSESKSAPPVVSVIATNPSHEQKVGKVEHPVRSSDGSVDLNFKTDSDKSKFPTPHLKAAPVQAIVGHSKKIKSVEAIVENLFELGSKKQEADSTNSPGPLIDSTSLNSSKPNITQTVPKPDSNVSDMQGESEDGDCKMRRKRKIDTPRKSMSPPPVKRALLLDHSVASVNPEICPKPCPSILPVPVDSSISTSPGNTNTNNSPAPAATPSSVSTSVLAVLEDDPSPAVVDPIKTELPTPECAVDPSATLPVASSLPTAATLVKSEAMSSSECPLSDLSGSAPKEDTKSAVVDVESKMEALFAGIIGGGDEGAAGPSASFAGDLTNPLTPLNESLDLDTSSNIAAVLEAKPPSAKKGRPKGSRNGIRQSSDSIFATSSTESTPQKGKKTKKKMSKDMMFGESPAKKNKKFAATGKKAKFQKEPSQQTCDSGSTVSSVRIRGPVVHCVGPRESPNQVSIVNAPARDDEDQDKSKKPPAGRRKVLQNEGKVNSSGTCSFTLVTRGELEHPTHPNVWICAFCKTGPHVNGAGDLFGPYLIPNNEDWDHDGSDKKKGKHSGGNLHLGSQLGMLPVTPSPGEKLHYVVWLHEDCVVWAAGVYFVGARLAGLAEAIWDASKEKCDRCRHFGANLGCLQHGCQQRAHYKCAQDSGWYLNEELFKSTCSSHPMREETN